MEEEFDFSFLKNFFSPLTNAKAICIITCIGVVVFFNSLFNGFVWDDWAFIINNPQIHHFNISILFGPNLFNGGPFYRPIPATYFATLYLLFGQQAFFYHLFQVGMHTACSCLLFIFFTKFFRSKIALFLSLLFLIHPINVESVAYIGATQSELYFLPGIIAMILAYRQIITTRRFFIISGLLFLSAFAKETGFIFILLVILMRYIYFRQFKRTGRFIGMGLVISIIYILARVFIGGVTFTIDQKDIPISFIPLSERLLQVPSIFLYYIKTFLYPVNLSIWQIWVAKKITITHFIFPLILDISIVCLLILTGVILYVKHKNNHVFNDFIFFSVWFFLGMAILLQIIPLDMTVADRWFYFPIVGMLGILGTCVQSFFIKYITKKIIIFCAMIILVIFSIRTIVRSSNYYDEVTLFNHDRNVQDNFEIEYDLGHAYALKGDIPSASKYFEESVRIEPTLKGLINNAVAYELLNNSQAARRNVFMILQLDKSKYDSSSFNDALVYGSAIILISGRSDIAKSFILQALPKDPIKPFLLANLAIAEQRMHDNESAKITIKKAYLLDSNNEMKKIFDLISKNKDVPNDLIFYGHPF